MMISRLFWDAAKSQAWVIQAAGKRAGRYGRFTGAISWRRVYSFTDLGSVSIFEVQFGPDGPRQWFRPRSLRLAEPMEVNSLEGKEKKEHVGIIHKELEELLKNDDAEEPQEE